jgi:dephospho-CoA kinase
MKVIGLTGSIAMGKTTVANIFKSEGVPVFDSDDAVHQLYNSKEGANLIANFVPDAVKDHKVDRQILSKHVVANPTLLSKLEPIVHAEIRKMRQAFIDNASKQNHPLVLLDIPLLFETKADADVDSVIVVSAPKEVQRQRAMLRNGMTEEKLRRILERQMPDKEKRLRADYIIENTGDMEDLKTKTLHLIRKLTTSEASHA